MGTGAMIGADDVFDAALRRAGVLRVFDFANFFSSATILDAGVRTEGDRLAIVTNAGGPGALAADHCADEGVRLASLSEQTLAALDAALPPTWSRANPVDVLGDATPDRYEAAIAACLADEGVDGVLAILTPRAQSAPGVSGGGFGRAPVRRSPGGRCGLGRWALRGCRCRGRHARRRDRRGWSRGRRRGCFERHRWVTACIVACVGSGTGADACRLQKARRLPVAVGLGASAWCELTMLAAAACILPSTGPAPPREGRYLPTGRR